MVKSITQLTEVDWAAVFGILAYTFYSLTSKDPESAIWPKYAPNYDNTWFVPGIIWPIALILAAISTCALVVNFADYTSNINSLANNGTYACDIVIMIITYIFLVKLWAPLMTTLDKKPQGNYEDKQAIQKYFYTENKALHWFKVHALLTLFLALGILGMMSAMFKLPPKGTALPTYVLVPWVFVVLINGIATVLTFRALSGVGAIDEKRANRPLFNDYKTKPPTKIVTDYS
jgi:heme A synthase